MATRRARDSLELLEKIRYYTELLEKIRVYRNQTIKEAFDAGVNRWDIATEAGITRNGVYKLIEDYKDGNEKID